MIMPQTINISNNKNKELRTYICNNSIVQFYNKDSIFYNPIGVRMRLDNNDDDVKHKIPSCLLSEDKLMLYELF